MSRNDREDRLEFLHPFHREVIYDILASRNWSIGMPLSRMQIDTTGERTDGRTKRTEIPEGRRIFRNRRRRSQLAESRRSPTMTAKEGPAPIKRLRGRGCFTVAAATASALFGLLLFANGGAGVIHSKDICI